MKRRAVAGLISVVAILLVSSFATVAMLALNSKQIETISIQQDVIEIKNKQQLENLTPTVTNCVLGSGLNADSITFEILNNGENTVYIDSILLEYPSSADSDIMNVTDSFYISSSEYQDDDSKISTFETQEIIVSNKKIGHQWASGSDYSDRFVVSTTTGKTFTTSHSFQTCS